MTAFLKIKIYLHPNSLSFMFLIYDEPFISRPAPGIGSLGIV
jgi:hypothetical protein